MRSRATRVEGTGQVEASKTQDMRAIRLSRRIGYYTMTTERSGLE